MRRSSGSIAILACSLATTAAAQLPDGVRVGKPHAIEDLTVFPILSDSQEKLGPILPLDEALENGAAEVREHKGGAQVNSLTIVNHGNSSVYVLAGTVVKGGNQDRQVSQDFIVPPKKRVAVDAFCVEKGRWNGRRAGKSTGGRFGGVKLLAARGVRAAGQHEKNQSRVWEKVADVNRKNRKRSSSGTLMATLDAPDVKAARKRLVRGARKALRKGAFEKTVGLAYAIAGDVKGVRWFANHDLFLKFEDTLLGTAAMDAITAREGSKPRKAKPIARRAVGDFVKEIESTPTAEARDTEGDNLNEYKRSRRGYGAKTRLKTRSAKPVSHDYLRK